MVYLGEDPGNLVANGDVRSEEQGCLPRECSQARYYSGQLELSPAGSERQ